MNTQYYWYVSCGELKFVDSYGNDATLDPVTIRYRKRMANTILYSDDIAFSTPRDIVTTTVEDRGAKTSLSPLSPTIISPADGSTGMPVGNTVTRLMWEPHVNGQRPAWYEVYIASSEDEIPDGSSTLFYETYQQYAILTNDYEAVNDSYIDIYSLLTGDMARVYCAVAACNSYGVSALSNIISFEISKNETGYVAPAVPTLLVPAASVVDLTTSEEFTVTSGTGADKADYYEFRLRKSGDSISSAIYGNSVADATNRYIGTCTFSGLEYGTEYLWTARATNAFGSSAYAAERTFTTIDLPSGMLWEEQNDGFDEDIQLAALYLAISRAADLAGGDAKVSRYFFDKFNYMQNDLRRKYNSAKYKNITIKPYSF